jgi:DNA polymerase III delta prime subunit
MEKIEIYFNKKNDLHHFIIIRGFIQDTTEYVLNFLNTNYDVSSKKGNLILKQSEKFLIEDARNIASIANRKNKESQKKFFILSFSFFNKESQNALLKILEEPAVGNHFIFIIPSLDNVLDTIKSRAILIDASHINPNNDIADKLIKMNFAERNKWLNNILKDIEKGTKDKNFLSELYKNIIIKLKQDKKNHALIENLTNISKNFNRPNISFKQNLEGILYLLP